MRRFSTAVTITDPLVKYQSLVTSGICSPDPAQHRLARHLHKVYLRIKDYSPQIEYRQRLNQVARLTDTKPPDQDDDGPSLAVRAHGIWRNPLFRHLLPGSEGRDSLALIRTMANYEMAIDIDSPKGLFLSGEVGTGKSMLLDLLAEGLPTERKKRWHFNTFMLYTLAQLERYRSSHQHASDDKAEYSLLWMAKKLVDESPILFLDEFQLPDRAASKILSHLFITFFQLGGVLVASSNRVPEDLQKASGIDYSQEPRYGIIRKLFGANKGSSELYGQGSDFAKLLEVLKARCDFWQMEGAQDWRRRDEIDGIPSRANNEPATSSGDAEDDPGKPVSQKRPQHYFVLGEEMQPWNQMLKDIASGNDAAWEPETMVVYGRRVHIPKHYNGIVHWDFNELVASFGPADYITMASSFHTFIIDNVPCLTILEKNEARRFITLLDALYEAKCKLIIRAESPPDSLFFPKSSKLTKSNTGNSTEDPDDATYSETIAEVYQDQMAPFRPNVSYYDTKSATSQYDPDQDSDFVLELKKKVDFGNTSAFTGEDERFAYKRAISRLWELCSARWHSRTGDWWQPLPLEARHWEGGAVPEPYRGESIRKKLNTGEKIGESIDIDEHAGLSKYRIEHLKERSSKEHG